MSHSGKHRDLRYTIAHRECQIHIALLASPSASQIDTWLPASGTISGMYPGPHRSPRNSETQPAGNHYVSALLQPYTESGTAEAAVVGSPRISRSAAIMPYHAGPSK